MIHTSFYITCDRCNRSSERDLDAETIDQARENAKLQWGWDRRKMPSGALWDFCPSCVERERNPQTSVSSTCCVHTDPSATGCCRVCGEQLIP